MRIVVEANASQYPCRVVKWCGRQYGNSYHDQVLGERYRIFESNPIAREEHQFHWVCRMRHRHFQPPR